MQVKMKGCRRVQRALELCTQGLVLHMVQAWVRGLQHWKGEKLRELSNKEKVKRVILGLIKGILGRCFGGWRIKSKRALELAECIKHMRSTFGAALIILKRVEIGIQAQADTIHRKLVYRWARARSRDLFNSREQAHLAHSESLTRSLLKERYEREMFINNHFEGHDKMFALKALKTIKIRMVRRGWAGLLADWRRLVAQHKQEKVKIRRISDRAKIAELKATIAKLAQSKIPPRGRNAMAAKHLR